MHPDARLWPSSRFAFNKLLYGLLQRLGLSRLHITPGCLRAGGATNYIIEGWDLGRLQFMGRWMQGGSLGAYIQEAMSMLVWLRLEQDEQSLARAIDRRGRQVWRQSPSLPWAVLFSRGRQYRALSRQHGNAGKSSIARRSRDSSESDDLGNDDGRPLHHRSSHRETNG